MSASASPKKVLGQGLSALLGTDSLDRDGNTQKKKDYMVVPVKQIHPNRNQPRKRFTDLEINELADSIRHYGLLQPLLVRETENGQYEIIAGERRWQAISKLRLEEVPVVVKEMTDDISFESALIENIQRQDLSPIEEAHSYKQILDSRGYTQDELGKKVGKSRSHIANLVRLLNLPESVQNMVNEGKISSGHARALINSNDPEKLAQEIIEKNLNVREVEQRARDQNSGRKQSHHSKDDDILNLEHQLERVLKTKVDIRIDGHRGNISLKFSSLEELDELITRLSKIEETSQAI
ncbi:MAG: ParB/RepB/Spo0J family partition protein [Alphaproteobacteria bacterium]